MSLDRSSPPPPRLPARAITDRGCPTCGASSRYLGVASQYPWVDYFRCDGCGQVWNVDKLIQCSVSINAS
jgi:hypothetical protein